MNDRFSEARAARQFRPCRRFRLKLILFLNVGSLPRLDRVGDHSLSPVRISLPRGTLSGPPGRL